MRKIHLKLCEWRWEHRVLEFGLTAKRANGINDGFSVDNSLSYTWTNVRLHEGKRVKMILRKVLLFAGVMLLVPETISSENLTDINGLTTEPPRDLQGEEHDVTGYSLGDHCEENCGENISHAFCNRVKKRCECEKTHPIRYNNYTCIEPLHLGEICLYEKSCVFYDPHAMCAEVSPYYSKCACKEDYLQTNNKGGGQKCVPDPNSYLNADVPTVFGVGIGLSLFSGLTCLVLKLFSRARFGQAGGHYANANLAPPIMMTGMSTPSSAPPSRRSSTRSTGTPSSRRPSYSMLAPPSRAGSRRPSTSSVRSQQSIRSYRCSHHDPIRATVSAPINDINSPSRNLRILELKFAQHAGYSRREYVGSRPASRQNSQEIITEVISESPEKM